jgi:hypothetical protein
VPEDTLTALRDLLTRLDERVGHLLAVQEMLLSKIDKAVDAHLVLSNRVTILEQSSSKVNSTLGTVTDNVWKLAVALLSGWLIYKLK